MATSRDIEESAEDLDASEATEGEKKAARERWERGQRDLVTSVIDYTLGTLVDLVRDKYIDLWPAYQRRDRWDQARKSRLIESFLLNIPIPPIFLNEDEYGSYSIIDGKQRVSAIVEFLEGKFPLKHLHVFYEAENCYFDELPVTLQRVLRTRASLRATILLHVSDPSLKYDVFDRLNTGGVHLNSQEVRNNSFRGPLNDLIMELSELPEYHEALQIKNKENSSIWREMRDAELVLRYFTFSSGRWWNYGGSIAFALNRFMAENISAPEAELASMRQEFLDSLMKCKAVFKGTLFRRWNPMTGRARKQVLAAIYDAQMLSVRNFTLDELSGKAEIIEKEMKSLFYDDNFQRAISAQTNTPMYFYMRVEMVTAMLNRVVR